jgi:ABC-type transport system involved in multi-copper enzyme maturation permease subunit
MTTATPYRSQIRPPRTGFGQSLRAEWTKFRTVRGWVIGILVAIGATLLIGILPPAAGTISCGDQACTPTTPPLGPDGTPVSDTFYFVHQPLTGDGGITVHLASLTGLYPTRGSRPAGLGPLAGMSPGTQPWTKGGIIVKQNLTPGSAYAAVLRTGGHGVRMQYDYTHDTAGAATASWLRLTRSGDTLTGYDSADGANWTEIGVARLPGLPTKVQIGLFVASPEYSVVTQSFGGATSRGGPSLGIAHFDDVSVRGGTGAWTGGAVTDDGRRNAASGDDGYTRDANGFTLTGSGDIAPAIAGHGVDNTLDTYLVGVFAGLIALIVVATMFVTAEYRRGLIRVTLAATPNRGQVLAAKAVVVGVVAFVAGLVAVALVVPLAGAWWYAKGVALFPTPTWTEVRAIVGTAALLAVSSVLAVAVGALLRRSAAAVTAIIVAIVLPYILAVASAVPAGAAEWLTRVTPAAAFSIMQTVVRYPQVDSGYTPADGYFPLPPWGGFAVLCGYAAVALVLATVLLRRRDA